MARNFYRQLHPVCESNKKTLSEAKVPKGAEFENIICVAYNMKSLNQTKEQSISSAETNWKPLYDEWLDVGNEISMRSANSMRVI